MGSAMSTERRASKRLPRESHGIELARIRPGCPALIADASAGGVLVETAKRLLPGSRVELQMHRSDWRIAIAGLVLRCAVWSIGPAAICYRGAIRFERDIAGFDGAPHNGCPLPIDAGAEQGPL